VCLSEGQNGTLLLRASLSVDGQVVGPHQWSVPYRAFHRDSAGRVVAIGARPRGAALWTDDGNGNPVAIVSQAVV